MIRRTQIHTLAKQQNNNTPAEPAGNYTTIVHESLHWCCMGSRDTHTILCTRAELLRSSVLKQGESGFKRGRGHMACVTPLSSGLAGSLSGLNVFQVYLHLQPTTRFSCCSAGNSRKAHVTFPHFNTRHHDCGAAMSGQITPTAPGTAPLSIRVKCSHILIVLVRFLKYVFSY